MANISFDVSIDQRLKIKEALIKNVGRIYSRTIQAITPKMIREADLIVKTAIDAYYDSYSPFVYNRTESLYSIFQIELTTSGFNLLFDENQLNGKHREGATGQYIYDVMFKKGYHGGAPYNGNYYWRWPSPGVTKETPPYIMWYPYGPAVQTESPWERIQVEWLSYCDGDGKQLLLNTLKDEIKKVIKEVS